MNRSILIVICDFIVSAMLTMIAGMSDAPSSSVGGGVPLDNRAAAMVLEEVRREQARLAAAYRQLMEERSRADDPAAKRAEMEDLTRKLAEAGARAELLEKQLALTPDTAGPLRAEELQRQLEHELNERHLLRLKQQEAETLLEELRRRNQETGEKYQNLREEYAARQAQLKEMERRAGAVEAELATTKGALAASTAEVGVLNREAANLRRLGAEDRKKREATEADLARLQAQLEATRQQLAEKKSENDRMQKDLFAAKLEVGDAQRKVEDMKGVVQKAVADLGKARAESAQLTQENIRIREGYTQTAVELKATQEKLADAQKQLRNDVQTCYSAAAMKVQLRIREKQLLIPRSVDEVCYLPLISLAGKTCLIGDLRLLLGNQRDRDNYANLTELGYTAAPAGSAEPGTPLAGPLLVPKASCALALIEVPAEGRTPLKALTPEQLKKRGVENLHLFKHGEFGKASAPLERRCALDFTTPGAESLLIRNAPHGTGGELRAEPGDFVMTRQGEFVGVVTAVESVAGQRQARCSLLPDSFGWEETVPLPLVAAGGDAAAFDRAVRPVLDQLRRRAEPRLP